MSPTNERTHRATYTVDQVARILGISRTTAYECVRRGEIPAWRFGRRVVVPTRAIDELLDTRSEYDPDDSPRG